MGGLGGLGGMGGLMGMMQSMMASGGAGMDGGMGGMGAMAGGMPNMVRPQTPPDSPTPRIIEELPDDSEYLTRPEPPEEPDITHTPESKTISLPDSPKEGTRRRRTTRRTNSRTRKIADI